MTSSNQTKANLEEALQQLSEQYINAFKKIHQHLPIIEHDEQWPSICELPDNGSDIEQGCLSTNEVFWQPTMVPKSAEVKSGLNFDNVESALGLVLHSDIKIYFTTLYSESLDVRCDDGALSLLFAWNQDDFERLQENLIGHILMKQRLKQAETVFFAVTDEEDIIISIDNTSGAVWVERVGCKPHKKLAESLTQFIQAVVPNIS